MSERAIKRILVNFNKTSDFFYFFHFHVCQWNSSLLPFNAVNLALFYNPYIYYMCTYVSDGIAKDMERNKELDNPGNIFLNHVLELHEACFFPLIHSIDSLPSSLVFHEMTFKCSSQPPAWYDFAFLLLFFFVHLHRLRGPPPPLRGMNASGQGKT